MEVQQGGQTFQQYLCAFIVSIGALFIGTSVAWTSPCLKFFSSENYTEPSFILETGERSTMAALLPLAGIFGTLPAGKIADLVGRKLTLIQATILQLCGSILATYANSVIILYASRVAHGLATGMYCVLIPMYIREIAEVSIRGALASFFEVLINLGIVYMYFLGMFDSYLILSHSISFTAAIYLFSLIFIPESPTYFIMKNNREKAEKSLKRLRSSGFNIDGELKELENWLQKSTTEEFSCELLTRKANIKGLVFASTLMTFQQLSGVISVVYFGERFFISSRMVSPTLSTLILGFTQSSGTIVSAFVVDRVGRKILLIISGIGMTICETILGYYFWLQEHAMDTTYLNWIPLVFLILFMFTFAVGFGPVTWIMIAELVGIEIKNFAFAVVPTICLLNQMVVTYTFHPLIELTGIAITFWMFTLINILAIIFVTFLPETKNKSLQQIQNELGGIKLKEVNENGYH